LQIASLRAAQGRLEDAAAEAEAGLRDGSRLNAVQLSVRLHGLLAMIAILSRQRLTALDHLDEAHELLDSGVTAASELVAWPRALAEPEHAAQSAYEHLAAVYDAFPRRLLLLTHDPGSGPGLVRIALQARRPDQAVVACSAARSLADRNPTAPSLAGAALHAEALLHDDLDAYAAAVERLRGCPRPLMLAGALQDAGEAAFLAGDRSRAVEMLDEALMICQRCAAWQPVERLRQRRSKVGLTRSTDKESPIPTSRLTGLTPSQLDVARVVARGKTNLEVAEELNMAKGTVDTHMKNIFKKLRIRSRNALIRIVIEEGES
jgi:DNA-binding CsgD family transcriptional regulator